jgi:NAD(P)-dependent dehydrogenase (short-subunit alcohol dehydrogenase family)
MGNEPRADTAVTIVTGGAQGIGRAVAHRLAADEVAVTIADIQDDKGAAEAAAIRESGGRALFVRADVSEPGDCTMMVERTLDAFGRLDYLVNNAYRSTPGTAEEAPVEAWDDGFAVMVRCMGLTAREVVPAMRRAGGGSIVNISSVHGLLAAERSAVYETCKAAVIGITRAMAVDFGPDGVRVNAVCPGAIVTEVNDEDFMSDRRRVRLTEKLYPLRRVGRPADVAAAVRFLLSAEASFITGHTLVVDGGLSVQLQDSLAHRVMLHLGEDDDGAPLNTPPLDL